MAKHRMTLSVFESRILNRAIRWLLILILALVMPLGDHRGDQSADAVQPDEILKDAKLEARARSISGQLRCLVCQNQSIDDSNAPLARDLRLLVRERLQKGDTDDQVMQFVVARYGEFALLKPTFTLHNLILWLTPLLGLLGGGFMAFRYMQRSGRQASLDGQNDLTDAERAQLDKLLRNTEGR